ITDANGCEVHANVAIPHKGYLQNDVPSSINLCYNGEITVDANEFDGYEWIRNGWVVDNNRFLTVKSPGTYIVKANAFDDCYAIDTISVTMSPTSFSPYFRMSSVSYINDTLVVMEMSQTNPDKYSWKYDTLAFDCDNSKGSERELRLIPKLSGIYSVTLSAENQDCVSDISKPVEIFATVRPDDELSPLYVERSIVKDFAISPNPTKGPITVEVNLSQISDVRLTIYDLNFGKIRKQVTLRNSDNYKLDINDILSSGAYVVILQTGNETKQIKYIVSR
ncbi:MAG: T9SS type A sorting domain-containing protein, partial [Bacteroidales bacterium]|nr:T9SS type A sorting domain-containing protein [Bacteroidales bacterium]